MSSSKNSEVFGCWDISAVNKCCKMYSTANPNCSRIMSQASKDHEDWGGGVVLFLFVFCFLNNTFCILFICSLVPEPAGYSLLILKLLSTAVQELAVCCKRRLRFFPKHLTSRLLRFKKNSKYC